MLEFSGIARKTPTLPFADPCAPFQTHFLIRMQASEDISEGVALPLDLQSQMAGRAGVAHFLNMSCTLCFMNDASLVISYRYVAFPHVPLHQWL